MPITKNKSGWLIETEHTGYAFGLSKNGVIVHTYWGARLRTPSDYPDPVDGLGWASFNSPNHIAAEEYPAWGGVKYGVPCLKITQADGVRDLVLRLKDSKIDGDIVHITLRDVYYPLEVRLHYRIFTDSDLIARWVTIDNDGTESITIDRVLSAQWHLPPHWSADSYRLSHLSGRWLDETHLQREPLRPGLKVLESRRLTTSHHANPWVALDRGGADEDQGEVWFSALAWSGNWRIGAEVTDFGQTRLTIGLNDWDFAWQLKAGESFETPIAYGGYTEHGFGAASRMLHRFTRDHLLPHPNETRKVLYNSWEATTFKVDQKSQSKLAEIAAGLGVELFVMDDGWFHRRSNDTVGLGDWWPDEQKFPNGLKPLIDTVHGLGMQFGLWIEPEMVNRDSDLYRAHPDWVIHFPTRDRTEARNQLILNCARSDVQDMLISRIDQLLTENAIAFIKWDMNRNVSEPGWPDAPGDQREIWVRYVQGVYHIWETLRARHPDVIWQSCSGGGGRADLGILRYADQIWVSDNTEATARLTIQDGFSQVYPAATMEAWVTDAEQARLPLRFRFHVSMCGVLGIGANLLPWSESDRAEATSLIALYKDIRPIVQFGDQYRLLSVSENHQTTGVAAVQYVSADRRESVLFAFRVWLPDPSAMPPIYLRGLQPDAVYTVEGIDGEKSGAAWMHIGLVVTIGNLESTVRRITRVR